MLALLIAPALSLAEPVAGDGVGDPSAPAVGSSADPVPEPLPTPTLTLKLKPAAILVGQSSIVTASLPQLPAGAAELVLLRKAGAEAEFTEVGRSMTDAYGRASWATGPVSKKAVFRVVYQGGDTYGPASAEALLSVAPRIAFAASRTVYQGQVVTFKGSVSPAHPGATVFLRRYRAGKWVTQRELVLSSKSTVTYRWKSTLRGRLSYRLTMRADDNHSAGFARKAIVNVLNPNPYGVSRTAAHFIVVDKSKYRLYYHERGRIVRAFNCVLGKSSTPTPLGKFRISSKNPHAYGPYGAALMGYHSPYAIHGTNQPWLLTRFPRGYSHGCTRLGNPDILWLYARCPIGTPVWNVP